MYKRTFLGELIGTFFLVLFGCGSVAAATLFGSHQGLFQIGILWGVAVTLGIYATRHLCQAHFNPAVSIAMAVSGRMKTRLLPVCLIAQFLGAFAASLVLYGLFHTAIAEFEAANGIVRGSYASVTTAKMFGEYYRQPGGTEAVSMGLAMAAELFGTFMLVLVIFCLTEESNAGKPSGDLAPVLIGLTVASLLCLIAPLTQAGLNPARDFAPRMTALIFGWGDWAFPDRSGGAFWVYILAPIAGGLLAALVFTKVLEPNLKRAGQ